MLVYFTSGIVGNMAAVLIEDIAILGASGAILGVLGYSLWNQFREVYLMILVTVIPGLFMPGISNSAHIGGLMTGFVIGMISKQKYKTDQAAELRKKEIEDDSYEKNESKES